MKRFLLLPALLFVLLPCASQPSVAGFFPLEGSGRIVYDFGGGWRFHRGDAGGAEAIDYDDSRWEVVTTPHSVELESPEVSGCRNYQGVAWYRKRFVVPTEMEGRRCSLHFEAVMGRQVVYVNGREALRHWGGFLPFTIDLTAAGVEPGDTCIIALMADNSDDASYPPGKPQYALDFTYHGGIYRDVWLIGKHPVALTEADETADVARGGVFAWTESLNVGRQAVVGVQTEVGNASANKEKVTVLTVIKDAQGKTVASARHPLSLREGERGVITQQLRVSAPHAWSPETPYLYTLETHIMQGRHTLDGGITRIGIRTIEWRGADGLWVNGQRYTQLIGGNRHQDFAVVGNAVPDGQQWRDALRLRNAGFRIVRSAHYPQDPAFMDACDELGLFVIVATPGWQFWNSDPIFAERVYQNTRHMIRRDRNHPCVILWEPILNETHFPQDFALRSLQITKDEYPHPGRPGAAADLRSAGVKDSYDVIYGYATQAVGPGAPTQSVFRREWGDLVDDWYAHNAPNRASRAWGEQALRVQAQSLWESLGEMFQTDGRFTGGCLWHPFDHQRGYHPDPFYGGIYDAYRQPKPSLRMMQSQLTDEPMVYISGDMTPFSPSDVVVWTNCDSVRLTLYGGARVETMPTPPTITPNLSPLPPNLTSPVYRAPAVFKDWWNFMDSRRYTYSSKQPDKVELKAEGIRDGRVVCTDVRHPSRRSTQLRLRADTVGRPLIADGSDFVVVVAEVTDDNGHVRRLARESVCFTVEGEGRLLIPATQADAEGLPRVPVEYGTAPILLQSTHRAGTVTIHAHVAAEGAVAPRSATLTLTTQPNPLPECYIESGQAGLSKGKAAEAAKSQKAPTTTSALDADVLRGALEEVSKQQEAFGE